MSDAAYWAATSASGGKLAYRNGAIAVPSGPRLGVELDRGKLGTDADLYRSLGGYPNDRNPARPDWFPLVPNARWMIRAR